MSNIVHVRIDDRLIHGQVANVWCTSLKVDRIIVANDQVAENEIQKSALRMSTPKGINTSLISIKKVVANVVAGKYGQQRILLIVNNPHDIQRLIDGGVVIKSFNIGNLSKREDTKPISKSVNVTVKEEQQIVKLLNNSVEVTVQMLPDKKLLYFKDLM